MDIEKLLKMMKNAPQDVRFSDLESVCRHFFGKPRQTGGSHQVYKTPWFGDPRINIQNSKGKAKRYQVISVLAAVEKLKDMKREAQ